MTTVSCPTCQKQHIYDTLSPYRPFCSERCRLIDLGAWSQERYRIPLPDDELPESDREIKPFDNNTC